MGVLGLEVTVEALDPGLISAPWRPKCWAIAHSAMNSRVDPDVICGPLSETASRTGRCSSLVWGSARPSSRRAATASSSPSISRASVKATSTWVEVSSAETTSVIHLRLTNIFDDQHCHPGSGRVWGVKPVNGRAECFAPAWGCRKGIPLRAAQPRIAATRSPKQPDSFRITTATP